MLFFFFLIQIILVIILIILVLIQSSETDITSSFAAGNNKSSFGNIIAMKPITKATWFIVVLFLCNTTILTIIYGNSDQTNSIIEDNVELSDNDDIIDHDSFENEVPIND